MDCEKGIFMFPAVIDFILGCLLWMEDCHRAVRDALQTPCCTAGCYESKK
jgi:hypothetical protein